MRPGEARANLRGASRVLARIAIANANGSYRRAGERSNRAETEGEALKLVDDAVLELVFNCPLTFDMSRRRLLLLGVALVAEALAPTTPRTVHLVVNPNSGSRAGLDILDAAVPVFERAGTRVNVLRTEYAGHALELAERAELGDEDVLVGIGGDGTAHELANGMLRRAPAARRPIGVLPGGSGNTWAYDLGLALGDAEAAAATVVAGRTRFVDVVRVDGADAGADVAPPLYAINICAYGFPAAVLGATDALRALGLGAQYDLAGLGLIARGRTRYRCELALELADGRARAVRLDDASFVQAQVNAHMGRLVPFAPAARVDDGLLDLVLVKSSSGVDIVVANALARAGKHEELMECVEIVRCRSFALTPAADAPRGAGSLNVDGELVGGAPFTATCMRGALEVLAPPPS